MVFEEQQGHAYCSLVCGRPTRLADLPRGVRRHSFHAVFLPLNLGAALTFVGRQSYDSHFNVYFRYLASTRGHARLDSTRASCTRQQLSAPPTIERALYSTWGQIRRVLSETSASKAVLSQCT